MTVSKLYINAQPVDMISVASGLGIHEEEGIESKGCIGWGCKCSDDSLVSICREIFGASEESGEEPNHAVEGDQHLQDGEVEESGEPVHCAEGVKFDIGNSSSSKSDCEGKGKYELHKLF
jgi:hypothetical protein